jgi:hypothetical protein
MELQSTKLDKITPALIGARKEIYGAVKNGKGNWGKYASLEDIIEAINEPLLANDIFVSQGADFFEGTQFIVTQATHISGQFIRSYTKIELEKAGNPQKALSSQTYTRRAGMESLFNIPRVDDDGEHGNVKYLEGKSYDKFIERVRKMNLPNSTIAAILKENGIENSKVIPLDRVYEIEKILTEEATDLAESEVQNANSN